jgi:UDP-glucose 4-epimerase
MNKVLVTGGKGFIGSNLVEYLISKGHSVSVIDIDRDGYEHPGVNYYYADITKPIPHAEDIFDGVTAIFHLAAEVYVQKSLEFPDLFKEVNEDGTKHILDYAINNGIKNIMFSSTSAIYGNKNKDRGDIETDTPDCLNAYSLSKYNAEQICKEYADRFNMNITVFRYFNVYGKGQHDSGQYAPAIGKFLKQRSNNEALTVVGDGSQRRDFVNVQDVVEANYAAYTNNKGFSLYNVGQGESISILELANLISDNIVFIPPRDGECRETLADISKIKTALGWYPKVSVRDWIANG